MKRPLAYIGLSVLAALTAAAVFSSAAAALAAVCALISAALFALRIFSGKNMLTAIVVFLSAAAALSGYVIADTYQKAPAQSLCGQTVAFSGVISSDPYTSGSSTTFTVRTDSVNGCPKQMNVKVTTGFVPDCEPFDRISAVAAFEEIPSEGFGLDYSSYCDARRIFVSSYISRYDGLCAVSKNERITFSDMLEKKLCYLRRSIFRTFEAEMPFDEAALSAAMVTGDRTRLPDEIRRDFSDLGIAHLIVVSGMHLSILSALMVMSFGGIFVNRYLTTVMQLLCVFSFGAATGFGFSVRRALVVSFLLIAGNCFYAWADGANSIGIAALIICVNPFAAGDIGVLSTFSSSLGVALLTGKLIELFSKPFLKSSRKPTALIKLVAVQTAASVGLLPILLLSSRTVSPYAMAANTLCFPAVGAVVFCGCAAAALSLFGLPAQLFLIISGIASRFMLFVTSLLCSLPFARQSVSTSAFVVWLILTAAALLVLRLCYRKGDGKLYAVVSATLLAAVVCADTLLHGSDAALTIDNSCGGVTAVLEYEGGSAVLCAYGESGRYYEVKDALNTLPEITLVIDIQPEGETGYTKKLLRDFDAECVVSKRSGSDYAWYEYCGGEVITVGDVYLIDLGASGTVEIYSHGDSFCEYLTINGSEILLSPKGNLPDRYTSPDVIITGQTGRYIF